MTRVTESSLARNLIGYMTDNRNVIDKLNNAISSGVTVHTPGDSEIAGTISQFQQSLDKATSYKNRITSTGDLLNFQENVLGQVNDLLVRAKEIAAQAANETNSPTIRSQMAAEAYEIRDHIVSLANSTYQGRYIYGGIDDNDPPYDAATYTNPSSGAGSQRYVYDTDAGSTTTRSISITDNLTITTNTPGNTLFDNAIQGLERLGRALEGYETLPASGAPTGAGAAYSFPTDYARQTADIKAVMDQLDTARQTDIAPERTDIAGRQTRIQTAKSLLDLTINSSQEALDQYQNTDVVSAATQLTQAQTALQASLQVSVKALGLSILDYI